jgi:hypothetical protein
MDLITDLQTKQRAGSIAVLIPELSGQHWWHYLLHAYRGRQLRSALRPSGNSNVVAVDLPWQLDEPPTAGWVDEPAVAGDERREARQALHRDKGPHNNRRTTY